MHDKPSGQVEIEHEGRTYVGSYTTDRGLITVRYGDHFPKTTQIVASPAERLARMLLRELVVEDLSRQ